MAQKVSFEMIDGAYGEGGGQVVRNSISLSAILGKPVQVKQIRANRNNPGLAPQHLTGITLVGEMCKGQLVGAQKKSSNVSLKPGELQGGEYTADTGTAGSICLLIQVSLPCALFSPSETEIVLKGGTNATMAPQVDYIQKVFAPVVKPMGINFDLTVHTRGFYPKGGGHAVMKCTPVQALSPLILTERGTITNIELFAFCSGVIRDNVPKRMCDAAQKTLQSKLPSNMTYQVTTIKEPANRAVGEGTAIIITATTSTGCILAGSHIGEKGTTAEDVGIKAANELITQITHGGCVDEYLQDQIIIYMALASGESKVKVGPLTEHTRTSIHFSELLTGAKFEVTPEKSNKSNTTENSHWITCKGASFQNKYLNNNSNEEKQ